MMTENVFQSRYKCFGYIPLNTVSAEYIDSNKFDSFIRVLYVEKGARLTIDFKEFDTDQPSLFFINNNQLLKIFDLKSSKGYFLYYNRDFYCVQIHDDEVACDGFLFNNIYEMPLTLLDSNEDRIIVDILTQIEEEFELKASTQEEMLRIYLKQIIIRATRIWKKQQLGVLNFQPDPEIEFFREFSRLVEIHYRKKHLVADYAEILGVAAKTLTMKFKRFELPTPNDVIKDRILLEAKRLLVHTSLSAKEIAYDLGYDDPAYFNRLFTKKIGGTPNNFRKNYI
jgi:AraC family transcriptional activator of pobA